MASLKDCETVAIVYTNYKGVKAARVINPVKLWYGKTEYHPVRQWLLEAWDVEKKAKRNFATCHIESWRPVTFEPKPVIKITGPDPTETTEEEQETVDYIVDSLDPVDAAALRIMLHFKCHGMVESGSGASSILEQALADKFGPDLEPVLGNLFARLR